MRVLLVWYVHSTPPRPRARYFARKAAFRSIGLGSRWLRYLTRRTIRAASDVANSRLFRLPFSLSFTSGVSGRGPRAIGVARSLLVNQEGPAGMAVVAQGRHGIITILSLGRKVVK